MRLRKPIETVTSHIITPHWYRSDKPGFIYEPAFEALDVLIAQLHGLQLSSELLIAPRLKGSIKLSVENPNKLDISVTKSHHHLSEYWQNSFVIRARGEWPDPNSVLQFCRDTGRIESRDVATRLCTHLSNEIINKILVLMNLYLPGSSRCLHYYNKDKLFGISSKACDSSFDEATIMLIEANLSPMPCISFEEFIEWSRSINGFWESKPTENVGRAMTFFSHAHHPVRIVHAFTDMLWIVAGLEALFTETSQEIKTKIVRRTILLCPEIEKFVSRKEIGRLYDFRSRFLHGDISLPNQFSDDREEQWYGHEFSRVFDLSSTILIRSIQRIAENGWTSLKFEESIAV